MTDDVSLASTVVNITYPNLSTISFVLTEDASFFNISLTLERVIGLYNLTFTANDTQGNPNVTRSNFTLTDLILPNVTINSPANATNYTGSEAEVIFNITVLELLNDSVILIFNNASGNVFNLSAQNSSGYWNLTFNVSNLEEGQHNVSWHVNDTSDNQNNTQFVEFYVDKTFPNNTITAPSGTVTDRNNITLTVTAEEERSFGVCSFRVTARVSGSQEVDETQYNCTDGSFQVGSNQDYTIRVNITDTAGNQNVTNISFTVDPTVTPSGGGGGGGGGAGVSKNVCNITVTPKQVFLTTTTRLREISVSNKEAFSYDPTYVFKPFENATDLKDDLQITANPGTILQGVTTSFGLRYGGTSQEIGKNILTLESSNCANINLNISINEGTITQVIGDFFDPDKSFLENVAGFLGGSTLKFESLSFFKNYMLYTLVLILFTIFTFNFIKKNIQQRKRVIVMITVIFMLMVSLFFTFVVAIIIRNLGG